jgi:hypothetical protein
LKRSLTLRTAYFRISMHHLRGSSALAAAADSGYPERLLRAAEGDARRLEREGVPWATALAQLLRSGVALQRQGPQASVSLLSEAVRQLQTLQMHLWAAAARRRLGGLIGGEKGLALVQEADDAMIAQSVRNPARMADLLVPGFA